MPSKVDNNPQLVDAGWLLQRFGRKLFDKGLRLFERRDVEIVARTDTTAVAHVASSSFSGLTYEVHVNLALNRFATASNCECHAFAKDGPCKHVVAVALAARADATITHVDDDDDAEVTAPSRGATLQPRATSLAPVKMIVEKKLDPEEQRVAEVIAAAAEFEREALRNDDPMGVFVGLLVTMLKRLRAHAKLPEYFYFSARSETFTVDAHNSTASLQRIELRLDDWRRSGLRFYKRQGSYFYNDGDSVGTPFDPTTASDKNAIAESYVLVERVLRTALYPSLDAAALRAAVTTTLDDRTLDVIRAWGAATPESTEKNGILSWRITPNSQYNWDVLPAVHKLGKRGQWSAGSVMTNLDRVRNNIDLLPQDEIAISRAPYGAAMLHALVGHPRVAFAEAPERLYTVQLSPPTLATVDLDDEHFGVELRLGGVPLRGDAGFHRYGFAVTRDVDAHVIHTARLDAAAETVLASQGKRTLAVSKASAGRLVEALIPVESKLVTEHAPALRGRQQATEDNVVARFAFEAGTYALYLLIEPIGGGLAVQPARGPLTLSRTVDGERVFTQRDPDREKHVALEVWRSLGLEARDEFSERGLSTERALDLLLALQGLSHPTLRIEWPKTQPPRFVSFGSMSQLTVRAASGIDWLDQGSVVVDEQQIQLSVVLDAVREGERYVELSGGRFLQIASDLREHLSALDAAREFQQKGGSDLAAALALERLAELGADIDFKKEMRELVARLRRGREQTPPLPRGLKATLRPYQHDGFEWLMQLSAWGIGGVLADDMGLGKTVQTLGLLLARKKLGPALVVAPTSVCANWQREIETFAPSLTFRHGNEPEVRATDVLIVSYGWLARNAERLIDREFATAIFDEAQALKNPAARRTLAARDVKAELKIAVTGTPIENRLAELWSLFRIVAPGLLGSQEAFASRFVAPIEQRQDAQAKKTLGSIVAPFILRRKKEVVAKELPEKTIIDVRVELAEDEMRLYDALRLAKIEALKTAKNPLTAQQRRIRVLAALTELRLAANHPRFAHAASTLASSKLTELLRLVAELKDNGHRALVFSQFPSFLAYVTAAFDTASVTYQYLDGQTPKAQREARIDAFEAGHGDVFVLSLLAGGTGINLTSADYVVILDPWWNPAVEDQAIGRAHRIGQRLPVTVYRLFSKGTIEEKIIAMQQSKRDLAEAVLENASSAPRSVSADELLSLLTQQ